MRLKEVKAFLKFHFGAEFTDDLLESPMAELDNLSPQEVVIQTSQSLEVIQIALGYRDPKTRAPLKHIPILKIDP